VTAPRLALDHIAVAVPRLEEAVAALEKLLAATASPPEDVPSESVRVAFLPAGGARLELIEGTAPESPIRRFLDRGQRGVHHLSFRVEGVDLDTWCGNLKRLGFEILGDGPRPGAAGTRVCFVHPRSAGGLLIEFSQKSEKEP